MRTRPIHSSSDPVPAALGAQPVGGHRQRVSGHTTVLLHEAIEFLDIQPDDVVVDATLGGAGHAREIVSHLGAHGTFIGFDLDGDAIARAKDALADASCKVELIEGNFRTIATALSSRGIPFVHKVLFDLGWSGFQLADGRGFSFNSTEALTMTYSKTPNERTVTAAIIVNTWSESSIADIIFGWGEDRFSRRIARAIVERRQTKPFETADDLAEVIKRAVPRGKGRIHPATQTFQALRIAVNDELGSLTEGLAGAWNALTPGGRIAVISFHSIEDRLVKRAFAGHEKEATGRKLSKKPIAPTAQEIQENPRSRSAKLRVIEKNI